MSEREFLLAALIERCRPLVKGASLRFALGVIEVEISKPGGPSFLAYAEDSPWLWDYVVCEDHISGRLTPGEALSAAISESVMDALFGETWYEEVY